MKQISIDNIKNGLVLARNVTDSDGNIIFSKGTTISLENVDTLLKYNINTISIVTDEVITVEDLENEAASVLRKVIKNKIEFDDDSGMQEVYNTAESIITDALNNPDIADNVINIKRKKNDIYSHMLGTSILCVIMGIRFGFSNDELKDIAIGSILHDIGMCDVKINYTNIEVDNLPADDKLDYRKHVFKGYNLLKDYSWISEGAKAIILSHHERQDGSGYPFHKRGNDIARTVKLVAICDCFDELVNGIGYEKRKVHEVVEFLRTRGAYIFDYNLLMKVVSSIAWFPTGCIVLTNEGETARVIGQNSGLPDRPVIRIIKDAAGNETENGPVKNLLDELTVFIVDTVEDN